MEKYIGDLIKDKTYTNAKKHKERYGQIISKRIKVQQKSLEN